MTQDGESNLKRCGGGGHLVTISDWAVLLSPLFAPSRTGHHEAALDQLFQPHLLSPSSASHVRSRRRISTSSSRAAADDWSDRHGCHGHHVR